MSPYGGVQTNIDEIAELKRAYDYVRDGNTVILEPYNEMDLQIGNIFSDVKCPNGPLDMRKTENYINQMNKKIENVKQYPTFPKNGDFRLEIDASDGFSDGLNLNNYGEHFNQKLKDILNNEELEHSINEVYIISSDGSILRGQKNIQTKLMDWDMIPSQGW